MMSHKRIQLWNSPLAQVLYDELRSARERRCFIEYLLENTFRENDLEELALSWQAQRRPFETFIQYLDRRGKSETPAMFQSTRLTPHLKKVRRTIPNARHAVPCG